MKKLLAFLIMFVMLFGNMIRVTPTTKATERQVADYTLTQNPYGDDKGEGKFIFVVKIDEKDKSYDIHKNYKYTYNFDIEWGDGNKDTNVTGEKKHIYENPGIYEIRISGDFPHFYKNVFSKSKILDIKQWGDIKWKSFEESFRVERDLIGTYTDAPNLEGVESMKSMFLRAEKFNGSMEGWDTKNVTDMSSMFSGAENFNQAVNFDTSKVTSMEGMFSWAKNFNQPLNFDTSNVTNMSSMFLGAENFNQLVNFDTSNVTNMSRMFSWAKNFNQPLNFDTSNVTNMSSMFEGAKNFNQPLNFDTSNVTNMSGMFSGAENFNQPLNFDTSNVTDMSGMFGLAVDFYSKVDNGYMFLTAKNFNQVLNFDTRNVTNMSSMFEGAENFNQPLNFDTSNVTNMWAMFEGAENFNQPVNFDTSKVESMSSMFKGATSFNQALNFDTSKVESMSSMFSGAKNFNQALNFDTSKVTYMNSMFAGAKNFNQPLNFDTSNVTNMSAMFASAEKFNQPLNFNTSKVMDMSYMFNAAFSFNQPLNFDTADIGSMYKMFFMATSFDQDVSNLKVGYIQGIEIPPKNKYLYHDNNMTHMFELAKLSTENYEKLLKSFNNQITEKKEGMKFHGGFSTYCSQEGKEVRDSLKSKLELEDGGKNCSPTDIIHSLKEGVSGGEVEAGKFTSVDDDIENPGEGDTESHIYELVDGENSFDNNLFDITEEGILTFKNAPDFENPTDHDKDNIYKIRVKTTDAKGETFEKTFEITVKANLKESQDEKNELIKRINEVSPKVNETEVYKEEAIEEFKIALEKAKKVRDEKTSTKEDFKKALIELNEAVEKLEKNKKEEKVIKKVEDNGFGNILNEKEISEIIKNDSRVFTNDNNSTKIEEKVEEKLEEAKKIETKEILSDKKEEELKTLANKFVKKYELEKEAFGYLNKEELNLKEPEALLFTEGKLPKITVLPKTGLNEVLLFILSIFFSSFILFRRKLSSK